MDEWTKVIAEALGCRIVDAAIGRQFWCEPHAAWSDDGICPEATRIAAALAPLPSNPKGLYAVCIRRGDLIEGPSGPERVTAAYLLGGGLIRLDTDGGTYTLKANERVNDLELVKENRPKHDRLPRSREEGSA